MRPAATLKRHSAVLAIAVISLFLAGSTVAQESFAGPPPLTIQPGTILTVRISQALSSDRNQSGDLFSGTLTQPVVVQGLVVAQRGQTVAGRVIDAKKAGRVSGVSQLRLALTSLTLVDGQNVPIQTQLQVHNGPTSNGRDAATIGGSTAMGSLIGAAVGWGRGAAIGAGVGAVVGTAGVLLTRGYATVVYPETMLAFQVTNPIAIDTAAAPQAFHAVNPAEYTQGAAQFVAPTTTAPSPAGFAPAPAGVAPPPYPYPGYLYYAPAYYPYAYPYPYYGYPYFYAPGISFVFGYPRYYAYPYYRYPAPYARGYVPRPAPRGVVVVRGYHGGVRR